MDDITSLFSQLISNNNNDDCYYINPLIDENTLIKLNEYLISDNINDITIVMKKLKSIISYKRINAVIISDLYHSILKRNVYYVIIDIFFKYIDNKEIIDLSFDIIDILVNNSDTTKSVLDYFYQKTTKFFYIKDTSYEELTTKKTLILLEMIKHLYGINLNVVKPMNYYALNHSEIVIDSKEGLTSFSITLNMKFDDNKSMKLLSLQTNDNISLVDIDIINFERINVELDSTLVANIDKKTFPLMLDEYNVITLSYDIVDNAIMISLYINNSIIIDKQKLITTKELLSINHIIIGKSMTGEISSIVINSPSIEAKYHKNIFDNYINGFSSLHQSKKFHIENLQYMNNIKAIFSSYASTFNIYDGVDSDMFTMRVDKRTIAHTFNSNLKKIAIIGGMNVLLPLIEIVVKNKHILNDTDGIKILPSYFEVIFVILTFKLKNMNDTISKHFFQMLSVFIETFDDSLFTEELMKIILDIGKNLFAFGNRCELLSIYIDYILTNENIYRKFSYKSQSELLDTIDRFALSDTDRFAFFVTIPKLINIMMIHETVRKDNLCCDEHYTALLIKGESPIEPSIKERNKLVVTMMKRVVDNNTIVDVCKCLLMEKVSLCFINDIIDVIIDYIDNKYKDENNDVFSITSSIVNVENNNNITIDNTNIDSDSLDTMFTIAFTVLANDYIDIKHNVLRLLTSLLKAKKNISPSSINSFINQFPFSYIKHNILPTKSQATSILSPTDDDIDYLATHCVNSIKNTSELHCDDHSSISSSTAYDINYINVYITKIIEVLLQWIQFDVLKSKMRNVFDIMIYVVKNIDVEHSTTVITNLHLMCYTKTYFISHIAHYRPLMEYIIDIAIRYRYYHNSIFKTTMRFITEIISKMSHSDVIDFVDYFSGTLSQIKFNIGEKKQNKKINNAINDVVRGIFLSILNSDIKDDEFIANIIFKSFEYMTMFNRDKAYVTKLLKNIDEIFIAGSSTGIANIFIQSINTSNTINYTELKDIWTDYELAIKIVDTVMIDVDSLMKASEELMKRSNANVIDDDILYYFNLFGVAKGDGVKKEMLRCTATLMRKVKTVSLSTMTILILMIMLTLVKTDTEMTMLLSKYYNLIIAMILCSLTTINDKSQKNEIDINKDILIDDISFSLCFYIDFVEQNNNPLYIAMLNKILRLLFYISKYKIFSRGNVLKKLFTSKKNISLSSAYSLTSFFPFTSIDETKKEMYFNIYEHIKSNKDLRRIFSSDNEYIKSRYVLFVKFDVFLNAANNRLDFVDEKDFEILTTETAEVLDIEEYKSLLVENKKKLKNKVNNELSIKQYKKNQVIKRYRNIYKKLKKKLFFWNGCYSNEKLFYTPNNIKYKLLHHYTKNYQRPFLVPIFDFEYSIPKFTHFDNVLDLFNDKSTLCLSAIDLDINRLLSPIKTQSTFVDQHTQIYRCCLVKPSHHIKGIFLLDEEKMSFYIEDTNDNNDDDYDESRKTCFGSYFVSHNKDTDKLSYEIKYDNVKSVFKRNYYYRESALEVFSNNNKSYYFNFKKVKTRNTLYNLMIELLMKKGKVTMISLEDEHKEKKGIKETISKISSKKSKTKKSEIGFVYNSDSNTNIMISLSDITSKWVHYKISNFTFLMYLNLFSNRSYHDISQYPVFPWFISDYKSSDITTITYRDLSLPMGMMSIDERSADRCKIYIQTYKSMKSDLTRQKKSKYYVASNDNYTVPYFYGSHYSNPFYVAHFLTRIFPYTHIMIELQGDKFDDPNRLFLSLLNSFEGASTQKGDVRELIPEFMYLPEMFNNINDLDMGVKSDKTKVNNVKMPPWCNNDPYRFVYDENIIFESDVISEKLNEWIDLIFGYKQRGKEAEKANNVFMRNTYGDLIEIEKVSKEDKEYYNRLCEFGITPKQLMTKPCDKRSRRESVVDMKDITVCKKENLIKLNFDINYHNHLINGITLTNTNDVIVAYSSGEAFKVTLNNISSTTDYNTSYSITTKKLYYGRYLYLHSQSPTDKISLFNNIKQYHPTLIYGNGSIIAEGGFIDGKISITKLSDKSLPYIHYLPLDSSPITIMKISNDERLALVGNKIGIIYSFIVNGNQWTFQYRLIHHRNKINDIYISDMMNAFISSSDDGYVNVYTLPMCKLIRSFKVSSPRYVFISGNILGSYIIYSSSEKKWLSISLNGKYLCDITEEEPPMSPKLVTDIMFRDCLIYAKRKAIVIKELPYLTEIYTYEISSPMNDVYLDISISRKYIVIVNDSTIMVLKDGDKFTMLGK